MNKTAASEALKTTKAARVRTKIRAGAGFYEPTPEPSGGGNGRDGGCPLAD